MDAECSSGTQPIPTPKANTFTYKELIEKVYETSEITYTSITDSCQKDVILNYICEKLEVNKKNIPPDHLNKLNQNVAFFFSRFLQKYREKFRKIKTVLSDPWAQKKLKVSESLIALSRQEELSYEMDTFSTGSFEEDTNKVSNSPTFYACVFV